MTGQSLDKEDTLLLLLSVLSGPGANKKVAGITRLEKLMFLLQRETAFSGKLSEKFSFTPWKFGPFSREIYDALELLANLDLVDVAERDLTNYVEYSEQGELGEPTEGDENAQLAEPIIEKVFTLTERGKKVAAKLRSSISDRDWVELEDLKRRFEKVPLTQLIQYVYHRYPETTSQSVLEHLKAR